MRESNSIMPLVKMSLNQVNNSVTKLTGAKSKFGSKLELSKSLMLLTKSRSTLKGREHDLNSQDRMSQEFNSDEENLSHHSLAGSVKEMLGKFVEDLQELCTEFKIIEPV